MTTPTHPDSFSATELGHGDHCTCSPCRGEAAAVASAPEDRLAGLLETAVLREVLAAGGDWTRRAFVDKLGRGALLGALAASGFPLNRALAAAAGDKPGTPEKADLKVGFIPITCATPIIMASPMGFYKKHGLNVEAVKTAGWAVVRDKTLAGEYDAAHMLAPMPLAISLGIGATKTPYRVAAIENINGQAITLALKHKDKRDPKTWKGFVFAVPFEYSMHNFLLRYYVAEAGLDPDKDIQIRVIPPPEMVANLSAGNIDGCLAPDPVNQRAVFEGVGFIHLLSKEIWDGHPCCSFAASEEFATKSPNSFGALLRAIVDATEYSAKAGNRVEIAKAISVKNYLNQPLEVVEAILTGKFPDGLGGTKDVPERINFDPYPYQSMAVWMLTQMKRWGYVKGDLDYAKVAADVYKAADCGAVMKSLGYPVPADANKKFVVMGKEFDPAKPADYVNGFAIKRA